MAEVGKEFGSLTIVTKRVWHAESGENAKWI
jgi:hypothetical protein